ncbi:uncharacterized protein PG986_008652 [Apiospora aurea]|uniref:Xylanolytic transcriptional activator regulatory domain-containing protein n=1 Tax=Apiospora aurea TaxID=335848 RepID=A0ABR1Q5D5_9PEZI
MQVPQTKVPPAAAVVGSAEQQPPGCQRGKNYDSRAPCRYCQTHGFACVTTQARKKRVFASVEESLRTRVGLLECLVRGLVPDAAATSADLSSMEGLRVFVNRPPVGEIDESSGRTKIAADPTQQQPTHEDKEAEKMPVLRDQQGQMQYIGPASSYIFQIRMRALLAGRDSHGRSQQGQFFLFANHAADKDWVGKVADLGREMSSAGRTSPWGESPASDNGSSETDGSSSDADDDGEREASIQADESFLSGTVPDRLVDAFFERIHPDFPVLSEDCFRRKYERFRRQQKPAHSASSSSNADIDASWICSLLCILILARRTVPLDDNDNDNVLALSLARGQEAEDRWWRKVQALLLAALHLNNTNNKDSCWTLTGAAVRIGIAIGLHRDDAKFQWQHGGVASSETAATPQNPGLLLRIRLWWTLYQFELMQAASLDRPSAVCDASCSTNSASIQPLNGNTQGVDVTIEYYSTRLLRMLSQACRVVRIMNNSSSSTNGEVAEDTYNGPLSPAASLIRDMRRWRDNLPRELSQQAATTVASNNHKQESGDLMTPRSRRTLLLMHVQYHHILCVVTRNPMLTLTSRLYDNSNNSTTTNTKNDGQKKQPRPDTLGVPEGGGSCNAFLADVCLDAAQASARLLLRLDADGLFDQATWWDFYFLYQAAQVLVLGVMYDAKRGGNRQGSDGNNNNSRLNTSRALLRSCAELAGRVARNPLVPGTIHRFAVVVGELVGLVEDFIRGPAVGISPTAAAGLTIATTNVPSSASSCFPVAENVGPHQQPPSYNHHKEIQHPDGDDSASQMDIDPAPIFQEGTTGLHHPEVGDDMTLAETPSDMQFPADMAAHFGFPDGSWTYREGQWNDFSSMILGGEYGP